ncbi:MAG: HlyD family type I secretion periplasmic adaptor subunit [Nitratireductor sp.]|nr:HlyD family type I secretion periplasmic adaptor subunit [Nitratireductor sp.]
MVHGDTRSWKTGVTRDTRGLTRFGYTAFAVALGIFVLWGAFFPLSSAVVAPGQIVSAGQNKLLQHPTGGVVSTINASNGDLLVAGDAVLSIEPVEVVAELERLRSKENLLLAKKSRLQGEAVASATVPAEWHQVSLSSAVAPDVSEPQRNNQVFQQQAAEMAARNARFDGELSALENQLATIRSERDGIADRITTQTRLTALLGEQEARMGPLADEGYIARVRLWEVQSRRLEADARLADLEARKASLTAREAEIGDRIRTVGAGKAEDDARELSAVLAELAALQSQIDAAERAVGQTSIRAPVGGKLVNFVANTVGGVIAPGQIIGEIVPSQAAPHVEARISPADIAEMHTGLSAQIVITALNRRLNDPIEAEVSYVPADSAFDESIGTSYFPVHLALEIPKGIDDVIQPGMEAEVYIRVASRSFFSYVLQPVSDSFRRAFRER